MVQLTVNYKGVDYNVKCEIDECKNYVFYVNDEYLTTVGGYGTEEGIREFAEDCIGGWVEGNEIYTLAADSPYM